MSSYPKYICRPDVVEAGPTPIPRIGLPKDDLNDDSDSNTSALSDVPEVIINPFTGLPDADVAEEPEGISTGWRKKVIPQSRKKKRHIPAATSSATPNVNLSQATSSATPNVNLSQATSSATPNVDLSQAPSSAHPSTPSFDFNVPPPVTPSTAPRSTPSFVFNVPPPVTPSSAPRSTPSFDFTSAPTTTTTSVPASTDVDRRPWLGRGLAELERLKPANRSTRSPELSTTREPGLRSTALPSPSIAALSTVPYPQWARPKTTPERRSTTYPSPSIAALSSTPYPQWPGRSPSPPELDLGPPSQFVSPQDLSLTTLPGLLVPLSTSPSTSANSTTRHTPMVRSTSPEFRATTPPEIRADTPPELRATTPPGFRSRTPPGPSDHPFADDDDQLQHMDMDSGDEDMYSESQPQSQGSPRMDVDRAMRDAAGPGLGNTEEDSFDRAFDEAMLDPALFESEPSGSSLETEKNRLIDERDGLQADLDNLRVDSWAAKKKLKLEKDELVSANKGLQENLDKLQSASSATKSSLEADNNRLIHVIEGLEEDLTKLQSGSAATKTSLEAENDRLNQVDRGLQEELGKLRSELKEYKDKANEEVSRLQKIEQDLKISKTEQEEFMEGLRKTIDEQNATIRDQKTSLNDQNRKLRNSERDYKLANDRVVELEQVVVDNKNAQEDANGRYNALQNDMDHLSMERDQSNAALDNQNIRMRELEEQIDVTPKINDMRRQLEEYEEKIQNLLLVETEMAETRVLVEELRLHIAGLEKDVEEYRRQEKLDPKGKNKKTEQDEWLERKQRGKQQFYTDSMPNSEDDDDDEAAKELAAKALATKAAAAKAAKDVAARALAAEELAAKAAKAQAAKELAAKAAKAQAAKELAAANEQKKAKKTAKSPIGANPGVGDPSPPPQPQPADLGPIPPPVIPEEAPADPFVAKSPVASPIPPPADPSPPTPPPAEPTPPPPPPADPTPPPPQPTTTHYLIRTITTPPPPQPTITRYLIRTITTPRRLPTIPILLILFLSILTILFACLTALQAAGERSMWRAANDTSRMAVLSLRSGSMMRGGGLGIVAWFLGGDPTEGMEGGMWG